MSSNFETLRAKLVKWRIDVAAGGPSQKKSKDGQAVLVSGLSGAYSYLVKSDGQLKSIKDYRDSS